MIEFDDRDTAVFDEIMRALEKHPSFEQFRLRDESTLSLPELDIFLQRRKAYSGYTEIPLTAILGVYYTRDIDYEKHTIGVYFRDDNENDARAKNAEYRKAKISDEAFEFLIEYLAEYRELLQHQDYLFINVSGDTAGQPLKVDSVYAMLDRAAKKTGTELTPHMLRRYFAVTRWNAGWPLELISQALGHKHPDTTIKYLGVLDDRLLEASREFYEKHSVNYGIGKMP